MTVNQAAVTGDQRPTTKVVIKDQVAATCSTIGTIKILKYDKITGQLLHLHTWTSWFMMEEYCPDDEVHKLESEFWNHKMVESDIDGYTARFHELARLVPHMVTPKSKRIDRYIRGLAPAIRRTMETSPC
ncbi:putative reverse transcriptase domain-containing protein [Tanacetum coccineum]|uniref:Reverse transcriptase domain-containing protein n=1 Tax=Tanacetum coccineum TaxID=301880 RepID=A0ABQ5CWU5_9ASTR